MSVRRPAGWGTVALIGLVQASIGAAVVIQTSVVNRVMTVELGLPASVPGALIALHFVIQLLLRPRLGFASDGGARVRWIAGGLVLLALATVAASASTSLIASDRTPGLAAAVASYLLLGAGVSASGTPLLALLAELIPAQRRARAAAAVWLTMIFGFVVTTIAASKLLAPFSFARLVGATATLAIGWTVLALAALAGLARVMPRLAAVAAPAAAGPKPDFAQAVRQVLAEPAARTFTLFVFASMLAYSAQDLILEPFAGAVFQLTPAQTSAVSGMHQGGMLIGMLAAAALASRIGTLAGWAALGCLASGLGFVLLAQAPHVGGVPLLKFAVLFLGVANGSFAVGAIGSMMALSLSERGGDAGLRMGVYGAAQAVAFGIGGFAGAAGSDVARWLLGSQAQGYIAVFLVEAALFGMAAWLAWRGDRGARASRALESQGDVVLASVG